MIQGALCGIRHIEESDLPAFLAATCQLQNRGEHLSSRIKSPANLRKEFLENGFSTDEHERMLIVDRKQVIVGEVVHFKMRAPATREIGYWLYDETLRGRGYVTEAVNLLVDYLFKALPINRLEILMAVANVGSERVAQKCGFTKEGVLREYLFSAGNYHDIAVYSRLRKEWQSALPKSAAGTT